MKTDAFVTLVAEGLRHLPAAAPPPSRKSNQVTSTSDGEWFTYRGPKAAQNARLISRCRQMILCLIRAMRFGRAMHSTAARKWVFPADSATGHLMEQKEDRASLSKWGNDLRQTFRTIAAAAGVSEFDARLLMNHAIPGVNAGYITRHKLLEDHLRSQPQAIVRAVFAALGESLSKAASIRDWLGRGAAAARAMGQERGATGRASKIALLIIADVRTRRSKSWERN